MCANAMDATSQQSRGFKRLLSVQPHSSNLPIPSSIPKHDYFYRFHLFFLLEFFNLFYSLILVKRMGSESVSLALGEDMTF